MMDVITIAGVAGTASLVTSLCWVPWLHRGRKQVHELKASLNVTAQQNALFMKEPVDPLLVMAREICAKVAEEVGRRSFVQGYLDGDYDRDGPEVQFTYEGLRKAAGGVE